MSTRSLIVLPDESSKPFLDAINAAKKSLQVKMFVFSDPELLKHFILTVCVVSNSASP